MEQNSGYISLDAEFPFRGVDFLVPGTQMDRRYSPGCLAIRIEDGIVSNFPDLTGFGAATPAVFTADATEFAQALIPFEDATTSRHFILISNQKQYEWGGTSESHAAGTWTDLTTASGDLSGAETNIVDWDIGLNTDGKRYLYVTNGQNDATPRITTLRWHGESGVFTDVGFSGTTFTAFRTCKTLSFFKDRLVIANVNDGGTWAPQTVYWSVVADSEDFDGTGSGSNVLNDSKGEIVKLASIGDRLAIFTSGGDIYLMSYVGGQAIFSFDKVVSSTNLFAPRSIACFAGMCMFLTKEDLLLFDGSSVLRPVGRSVSPKIKEVLDTTAPEKCFIYHHEVRNRLFVVVPQTDDTCYEFTYDYDLADLNNSIWSVYDTGSIARRSAMGTYDAQTAGPNPLPVFVNKVARTLERFTTPVGDYSLGQVSNWQTADFTLGERFPSEEVRWIEMEFEARSGNQASTALQIFYSTDDGITFNTVTASLTIDSSWDFYRTHFDYTAKRIRFRFNTTSTGVMEIRRVRVWGQPAGEHRDSDP